MNHIKIFEEFNLDQEEIYDPIPFLQNEINLLKTKLTAGVIINAPDVIFGNFILIEKIHDSYYIVAKEFKCTSLHDVIKLLNNELVEIVKYLDELKNVCNHNSITRDEIYYTISHFILFFIDKKQKYIAVFDHTTKHLKEKYNYLIQINHLFNYYFREFDINGYDVDGMYDTHFNDIHRRVQSPKSVNEFRSAITRIEDSGFDHDEEVLQRDAADRIEELIDLVGKYRNRIFTYNDQIDEINKRSKYKPREYYILVSRRDKLIAEIEKFKKEIINLNQ